MFKGKECLYDLRRGNTEVKPSKTCDLFTKIHTCLSNISPDVYDHSRSQDGAQYVNGSHFIRDWSFHVILFITKGLWNSYELGPSKWQPPGGNIHNGGGLYMAIILYKTQLINCSTNIPSRLDVNHLTTLRLEQNGNHIADDIFTCIFLIKNEDHHWADAP